MSVLIGVLIGWICGFWCNQICNTQRWRFYIFPILGGAVSGIYDIAIYSQIMTVLLISIAQIDYMECFIHDDMIYVGLFVSMLASESFIAFLIGILAGACISGFQYYLGHILFGSEARSFGTGDITLSCLIGSLLSMYQFLEVYFLGLILAVILSAIVKPTKITLKEYVPFAPALTLAVCIQMIYPISLLSLVRNLHL